MYFFVCYISNVNEQTSDAMADWESVFFNPVLYSCDTGKEG